MCREMRVSSAKKMFALNDNNWPAEDVRDLLEPNDAVKEKLSRNKKKTHLNPANSSFQTCPISDERQGIQECWYDVPSRVKFEIANAKILSYR